MLFPEVNIQNNLLLFCRIKSSLDKTLKGQYNVTIKAKDKGDPSLDATNYLDVSIVKMIHFTICFFISIYALTDELMYSVAQFGIDR